MAVHDDVAQDQATPDAALPEGAMPAQIVAGDADPADDPRLLQAVQEYLAELEAGRRPRRQEFVRRYPDIAASLGPCLDGLDLVHQAALKDTQSFPPTATPGERLPADPLGDFQIIREIGRGGMGIVYEAVQLSLGRQVALKVLPFASTLDQRRLQRFKNEAQAAAQLHHTNIVPVHAVGCERGVHFYAMQMIDGHSLATVIEQMRGQAAGDRDQAAGDRRQESGIRGQGSRSQGSGVRSQWSGGRGHEAAKGEMPAWPIPEETSSPLSMALSTQRTSKPRDFYRSAAGLMVQAAEALEHAHQFGIVHRDIKPANLLIDARGQLWITDFGLAQVQADASLTQTGDLVGTLRYMSPEQASGQSLQLDQRTDIYSLGATLYELVTLRPIVDGKTR
ncbi:MAG: serine/threonine protein kinase, partial [Gemmataceae bacterium]|nr:serine/threonine protein kinase [Gemmataceae bacterium]